MSYPFVREFQVFLAPFVRFGALSTELDILSMGDRVRLLSSALPPQICSNNGSSAPLSLTVFPEFRSSGISPRGRDPCSPVCVLLCVSVLMVLYELTDLIIGYCRHKSGCGGFSTHFSNSGIAKTKISKIFVLSKGVN